MIGILSTMKCPKCENETFEVIGMQSEKSVDFMKDYVAVLDKVYYAQCTECSYEMDGYELLDLLEKAFHYE